MTTNAKVKVNLDKERTLLLDFEALEVAEELTGTNFITTDPSEYNSREWTAIVYACLKHEDPALTRDQVKRMLTPATFLSVQVAVLQLYQAAMPEDVQKLVSEVAAKLEGASAADPLASPQAMVSGSPPPS